MLARSHATQRRGTYLAMLAMSLTAMMGFLALAVDIGLIAVARNQCQNAADASAMAGARTITGSSTNNYNFTAIPGNAITAGVANQVLGQTVQGDPVNYTTVNAYTYSTGQITVQVGTYAYVYNDSSPSTEGFQLQIPRQNTSEPYSAVQSTVTYAGTNFFAKAIGMSAFNTSASATAIHRPRDVMIIVDLSGSMRFQSLPGVPLVNWDIWGDSGTFSYPQSNSDPRAVSMNPETVFPQFGHYADTTTAALMGNTSYQAVTGEVADPSNLTSTQNSGPPILADWYQNAAGVTPTTATVAWTRTADSQATTPGGDDPLHQTLGAGTNYAKTVADFNKGSSTTNPTFEVNGYTGDFTSQLGAHRTTFNMYTQGPGYWGKTFFIWPPAPRGPNVLTPPTSLTDTTFNWYNNQSNDWRQRFFVAVNTSTSVPSWLNHNTILFDTTGSGATMNMPGINTTVTENGSSVTYTFRINYAAILYWIKNVGANPFPSTLQAGRIRYYSAIPDPTVNTLNKRWWAFDPSNPSGLSNDEMFWKEYIDFVLGYYATGPNTYQRFQNGVPYSALIGNGDYYQWTGSTFKITQRPQPQPSPTTPGAPYLSTTVNNTGGYAANSTTIKVASLGSSSMTPVANQDYAIINSGTTPYLITAVSTSNKTLTISPGLTAAVANGVTVQVYSAYMNYTDCPMRPRHQYWFGPMTLVDWLGNYNLYTLNGGNSPHHWWAGNVHESHSWACKAGVQTAINDIQANHPSDFVGLTFFSTPSYYNGDTGHHNKAVVALGQNYQQMIDSLWFPPTTVTGGVTEISPYDADMFQVPHANGGTSPEMGFMIAYNQLSSSATNLRFYAQPSYQLPSTTTPNYRGSAGGLGRKGANKLIIFETDGFPNTKADASLAGSGADSYYPIRVYNPANMTDSLNVEWPSGGGYQDSDVFTVVQQVCALTTASSPGFSTTRKPCLVHCIGYGSIFDPSNSGSAQTTALTFLETVQYYGNTSTDKTPTNFPSYKKIYGTSSQRITNMQTAFKTIMQSGVQVSLIQ